MSKHFLSTILFVACFLFCAAQDLPEPSDYLTPAFHKGRREAFRAAMPPNSVAVIFAFPERVFSQDVNYVYHQNPDLYYLSGYQEAESVLLLFKDDQKNGDAAYHEMIFARKRDPQQEQWTGRRLGVEGVKTKLGFTQVFNGEEFADKAPDLTKFSKIIYDEIPGDLEEEGAPGSLGSLYAEFRKKANIPVDKNKALHDDLKFVAKYAHPRNLERIINYLHLQEKSKSNAAYAADENIQKILHQPDSVSLEKIRIAINPSSEPSGTELFTTMMNTLREIKTPEEMELVRKSVVISAIAHAEVMKAMKPGQSERELEGILTYVHKKYGAEEEGYPPIVGAGANGCILHYEENTVTDIKNDLVLMDVAAMYHGYSADITRTVPPTGKFTPEQKTIYDLVYAAQEEIFKLCKEGNSFSDLEKKSSDILTAGLIKLGLIKDASETRIYYPHGCSHYIGLDVHDRGNYGALKANMVITVEPGIYIPAGSKCDKKWWNIGVRIEDDVLINKDGYTLLSKDAPRKSEDVEKMVMQKSMFESYALPALK